MRRERVNWRRAEVQEAVKAEVRQVPGKRQVHRLLETIHQGAPGGTGKNDAEPLEKRANLYPQHEDHEIPPHGLQFCEEYQV